MPKPLTMWTTIKMPKLEWIRSKSILDINYWVESYEIVNVSLLTPLLKSSIYWVFYCVAHNKLWKILKDMGIPYHLTCLLRNLYAGQEATVKIGHGTTDWFQIGKEVCQGCILSRLFNLYAEYIMRNAGLEEAQAAIKISARNSNNLR